MRCSEPGGSVAVAIVASPAARAPALPRVRPTDFDFLWLNREGYI